MKITISKPVLVAASAWVLCASAPAWADGMASMERFLAAAHSGSAAFEQTVIAPGREGQPGKQKKSSGTFAFKRPGQFRFDYSKPYPQVIVADGKTLWFYDEDLNQVTQRDQAQALSNTPAALLTAGADLATLRKTYDLNSLADSDALSWLSATPKDDQGQIKEVRLGFDAQDQISQLRVFDRFGQESVVRFTSVKANPTLAANTFDFVPPKDASRIKQ